jgi:predicted nucleic acid-binding protein
MSHGVSVEKSRPGYKRDNCGIFLERYPRVIYDLVSKRKLVMLLSSDMEKEYIRVLGYPKFDLTSKEIPPFIRNLRSNADYIISGDKHILDLGNYKNIS